MNTGLILGDAVLVAGLTLLSTIAGETSSQILVLASCIP